MRANTPTPKIKGERAACLVRMFFKTHLAVGCSYTLGTGESGTDPFRMS